MRAARKAGALSKKIEKASANQYASADKPLKQNVLKDAGISHQQASDWERLSEVPEDEFEAALPSMSVRSLIDKPTPVDADEADATVTLRPAICFAFEQIPGSRLFPASASPVSAVIPAPHTRGEILSARQMRRYPARA